MSYYINAGEQGWFESMGWNGITFVPNREDAFSFQSFEDAGYANEVVHGAIIAIEE